MHVDNPAQVVLICNEQARALVPIEFFENYPMNFCSKIRLLGLTALLLVSACSNVAPWERGRLAKSHMALVPNPMQSALQGHTYGAREAASSGGSAQGGGCGCY